MATRFAMRRLGAPQTFRSFSTTRPAFIKVGDKIPNLNTLVENSPGNKVNLSELTTTGKALIIGVPAAFSMFIPFTFYLYNIIKMKTLQRGDIEEKK